MLQNSTDPVPEADENFSSANTHHYADLAQFWLNKLQAYSHSSLDLDIALNKHRDKLECTAY